MSHSIVVDRRARGHTKVRSNEELSDERGVVIGFRTRSNGARGHILDVRTLQLGNRRIDATIDDRDDHAFTRVALSMQRRQRVARIVGLIGGRDLAIHRLRRGRRGKGREHRRQGQRAGRGQNG